MAFRRFIIKVLLFSSVIIAMLAVGELVIRNSDNPYKQKYDYMEKHAGEINTLILGHSQTYYGLVPGLFPGHAFNLAMVSQTLSVDRMLLERYIGRMTSLERVIVPVTYTSLYENNLEDGDEWWRVINYELYMDMRCHSRLSRYGAEIFRIEGYAGKLGVAMGISGPNFEPDSTGHGMEYTLDAKYDEWRDTGEKFARYHTQSLNYDMERDNVSELISIHKICSGHDVELILVTPPLWYGYRDNINGDIWNRTVSIIKSFSLENGVVWLDYSCDSRFDDDDFYDADHLTSDVGAVKFTRFLVEDIE